MDSAHPTNTRRELHAAILAGLLGTLAAIQAHADGARNGVTAKPGEMVMLRNVAARPAYRQGTPGMALLVDPAPRQAIARTLGDGELGDSEFSALDAGQSGSLRATTAPVAELTRGLGQTLSTGNRNSGVMPAGAGGATRGLGDQITGALSPLPLAGH